MFDGQIKRPHYDFIDLAKGIGIILIIMGHGMFPCHFALSLVDVPLFFFIAGMTFPHAQEIDYKNFFLKKFDRIIVPYIFFSIISSLIELIVGKANPATPFNGPLWFLPTFFSAIVFYAYIRKQLTPRTTNIIFIFIPLLAYLIPLFPHIHKTLPFGLDRIMAAMTFIHLGNILKEWITKQKNKYIVIYLLLALIIYVCGFLYSITTYDTKSMIFVKGTLYSYNIILFWITSVSGIISILFTCLIIHKIFILNWLGKNSLIILCVHFLLIEHLNIICSNASYYNTIYGKICLAAGTYIIVAAFCSLSIFICRKYIPCLTGYKPLLFS